MARAHSLACLTCRALSARSAVIAVIDRVPEHLHEMLLYNTLHLRISHTYLGISTKKALLKANALIGELSRLRSAPGRRISAHGVVGIMPRCVAEFRGRDLSKVQFYQAVLAHAQSFNDDCIAVHDGDELFVPRASPQMSLQALLVASLMASPLYVDGRREPPCTWLFEGRTLTTERASTGSLAVRFTTRACDNESAPSAGYPKSVANAHRALWLFAPTWQLWLAARCQALHGWQ